jgi:hypothetical protein
LIENVLPVDEPVVVGNFTLQLIEAALAFLLRRAVTADAVGSQKRLDLAIKRHGRLVRDCDCAGRKKHNRKGQRSK